MLRILAVISCLLVICSADAEDQWQQQVQPIADEAPQKKPFTYVEFMEKWGHIVTMTDLKDLKDAKHPRDLFSNPTAIPVSRQLLQVALVFFMCSHYALHARIARAAALRYLTNKGPEQGVPAGTCPTPTPPLTRLVPRPCHAPC